MPTKLPLEKIFRAALKNGGDFSDIFYDSTVQSTVNADNNRIEKALTGRDAGIGLRVIHDGNTAYGYTNDISEKSVCELAKSVAEAVKGRAWGRKIAFLNKTPLFRQRVKIDPGNISLEQKVGMVKTANKRGWSFHKNIRQLSVTYKDTVKKVFIANSAGEIAEDERFDTTFTVLAVVSDGNIIQTGYEAIGGFAGFELLEDGRAEVTVGDACRRAILMLSARPAPAGTMPVVLSSEAGGTMIHEAVGHGLEADLANGGFSVYKGKIGMKVANSIISVVDDATLPCKRGSFSFDDEGTDAQRTLLIKDGVLVAYMHNKLTAWKTGVEPTGNGRRESYHFRPSVRMTNTMILPGTDDPESVVKCTDSGLFIKKMGGGHVNTVTGDFVFEVQEAYIIRSGAISEPVRGATLTGNGPEVLKIIDKVGSDLGFSIGTCGKDRQGVPVSCAQPTIRIPKMIIGGKQ